MCEIFDGFYINQILTTEAPEGENCQVLISMMFVSSPRDLVWSIVEVKTVPTNLELDNS